MLLSNLLGHLFKTLKVFTCNQYKIKLIPDTSIEFHIKWFKSSHKVLMPAGGQQRDEELEENTCSSTRFWCEENLSAEGRIRIKAQSFLSASMKHV